MIKSRRRLRRSLFLTAALVVITLFVIPLVWALSGAIRPSSEVLRYLSPLSVHTIVPETFLLENFVDVFEGPFGRAILNTLIVTGVTVVVGGLICAMAAFGLSVPEFRYRNQLFAVVVISFMIPFEGIALPLADLFRSWGLENSYAALILPGLGEGLAIFQLRQFFLNIPKELREAATLDGAGWWTLFWRVYLPVSRPALVGAGMIIFIFQWQAYLWPLLIISDERMNVASVALARLLGEYNVEYGQLFAGAIILAVIPAILLLMRGAGSDLARGRDIQ